MNRRKRILGAALAATTAATLSVAPGALGSAAAQQPVGVPHLVTLITGDQVRAERGADGQWSVGLEPVAGAEARAFHQFQARRGTETDSYLIPADAAKLVSAGALDRELFNITGLIRQGYDDARTDSLPLLAEYPDQGAATRAAAPPGGKVERTLPELGFAVISERKRDSARFWRSLTGDGPVRALSGPRKVWLNAKVRASLDASVPKVNAPAAWQAGFTGKGVTVAVLDTGADGTHPDLAGKITATKDFTGKGNTGDGHGHGTHVAATVAGVGAPYKGVAPDAALAVGKVLDDHGSGPFDAILAGMQWAAAETKAKIVSMSLGGYPTDGTDPLSQGLNTLSRKHGTLFVVAAGNGGGDEQVGTPAAADTALAVGNTTKADRLAPSSSRGPRTGDGALKPEIAAPGTDIVAAKAKGTQLGEPVGEHHTKLTGTSMATPHVAGGAALLAQQHPDWSGERIKSALVSGATGIDGLGAFAVGGGRMDLARATSQRVQALSGSVSSYLRWPSTAPQKRTLTYQNDGAAPVTLALNLALTDVKGGAAPAGLAKLSASSITVPAKGKADVELTTTPRSGKPGAYSGVLVASTSDGAAQVRTPVAVHDERELYEFTAEVRDRKGGIARPENTRLSIINVDTAEWVFASAGEAVRLPKGNYTVTGSVDTPGESAYAYFAHPDVRMTGNTTVRFDARKAKPVSLATDQPAARGGFWTQRFTTKVKGYDYPFTSLLFAEPKFTQGYAYSEPGVSSPNFGYADNYGLRESRFEVWAEKPKRFEVNGNWFRGSPTPSGTLRFPAVHGGQGTEQDLAGIDAKGKLVMLDLPGSTTIEEVGKRIANVHKAGGAAAALRAADVADSPARADNQLPIPAILVNGETGQALSAAIKAGGVELSFTSNTSNKYRYELGFTSMGQIPGDLAHKVKTSELATVRSAYHAYDDVPMPNIGASVDWPLGQTGTQFWDQAPAQSERVEHFTPGTWEIGIGFPGGAGSLAERITLEGGKSYRLAWDTPVAGPGFRGMNNRVYGKPAPWVARQDNTLDVTLPVHSDGAGRARTASTDPAVNTGTTSLYAGEKLIGSQDLPGRAVFVLPDAEQKYRLVTEVTRKTGPPTSTKVSAAWTFTSGRAPGPARTLSLLAVRFSPATDLRNLTPGGKEFSFPVRVESQDVSGGADKLEVEVSYDDGAKWQPAALKRDGDHWTATVTHPASGFAALRAKASDADGNAVEQTILRAYQIGG